MLIDQYAKFLTVTHIDNGYRIHVDIICQEKNFRQFRLITWNTFSGQFVNSVEGDR